MMHHTLPTQPRMPPTKPNHQARAQALVRHRHMREKQEFLEARKSSLQHTIETAREELTRVEVAIARNVLTMMQTPKPRIMVESFRNQTFEIPMEEEDVNARLTPSEVKAALRQSHQLRHIAKAMPAAVPITVPKVQLIGPLPRPALDLGATVRPSSAERKEASKSCLLNAPKTGAKKTVKVRDSTLDRRSDLPDDDRVRRSSSPPPVPSPS